MEKMWWFAFKKDSGITVGKRFAIKVKKKKKKENTNNIKRWQNLSSNKNIGCVQHVNHNRWRRYPRFGSHFDAPVCNVC